MLGTPSKSPKTTVDAPSIDDALAVDVIPAVSLKLDKKLAAKEESQVRAGVVLSRDRDETRRQLEFYAVGVAVATHFCAGRKRGSELRRNIRRSHDRSASSMSHN